ncbi:uncharacterized protein J4E78_001567 [Alternaria triticimaculans]|uniref:uncharacterized protein n=1 Tax=Alternaria triticimaculans TaxID=297637 RepID=UPI0020C52F3B|nr:uncharacterized protein J4E78_001567 [Alternaria triticimaculans]KAI4673062.1 hypothetical protein J4E78_001567 [Alternaria triticimaculans]
MAIVNERDFPPLPSPNATRRRAAERVVETDAAEPPTTKPLPTLSDLPTELILQIINYFPGMDIEDFQLPTLLSLALTSRRFYNVVIDKIYSKYDSHFCEPYLFLRTMIEAPRLTKYVHNVEIQLGTYSNQRYHATASDKKSIKEGLRALGTSDWKEWAARCNGTHLNDYAPQKHALQNATLLHAPKIKHLGVRGIAKENLRYPSWIDLISKAATSHLSSQVHRFEKLQSISVEAGSLGLSELAPLFRLQSLRKLHLCQTYLYGYRQDDAEGVHKLQRLIPRACNDLEELDLESTYYTPPLLEVLVSSSRCLKSIKYETESELHLAERPPENGQRYKTLSEVLLCQKASLETLWVCCDPVTEDDTKRNVHLRDNLKDFASLKHLSCPLGMLLNHDDDNFVERLPSSLLTFRTPVRNHTEDQQCLEALRDVVTSYREHVPDLEEVRAVAPEAATWFTYDWEPLVKFFSAETGISFVVEPGDTDDDAFSDWDGNETDSSQSSDEVDLYSDED